MLCARIAFIIGIAYDRQGAGQAGTATDQIFTNSS